MSMQLRYQGGFYSLNHTLYEIEIYQQGYMGGVSTVAFCTDPLQIEWPETDKLEPVQSSNATLQLYSDSDRQFIDLYTIKPGNIRMDILREKKLYWSGTLDPELYEEPFAYQTDYGVKLTFSDMAILERVNFSESGFLTLRQIAEKALEKTGIRYTGIDEFVSTGITSNTGRTLSGDVSFLSDNYYDEDGKALSWREVLEETLRPFALRLIQKGGRIILYDLNAVYTTFEPEVISWNADNATLGVDRVYNNVTVAFSPYHHNNLLDAKVNPDDVGEEKTLSVNINDTENISGFTMTLSEKGKGFEKSDSARYFKIMPVFSGSEEAGIAWTVKLKKTGGYVSYLNEAAPNQYGMLLRPSVRPFLAYVSYLKENYKLQVSLDMLADVRYNPFEPVGRTNEEGDFNTRFKHWCNFAYVPFRLILRDEEGNALYHYENKDIASVSGGYKRNGIWKAGEGTWGDAYLAYYDVDNRKSNTGLGGWKTNKQCIGYYQESLPTLFHKRENGEFIDLPYTGGWLEVLIGSGLLTYDHDTDDKWQTKNDIYWRIRWLLYRNVKIKLVDKNYQSIDAKDVEYTAWINPSAKEDLKIDTVVGCLEKPSPTALGQVFLTHNKTIWNTFYRAGVKDCLERLLIGTVYSNYASRHHTLGGTVSLLPSFGIYTDTQEPGRYLLLSETQLLSEDVSEIKIVQFEEDHFEGINYKED